MVCKKKQMLIKIGYPSPMHPRFYIALLVCSNDIATYLAEATQHFDANGLTATKVCPNPWDIIGRKLLHAEGVHAQFRSINSDP